MAQINCFDFVLRAYAAKSPGVRAGITESARRILSKGEYETFRSHSNAFFDQSRKSIEEFLGDRERADYCSTAEEICTRRLVAHLHSQSPPEVRYSSKPIYLRDLVNVTRARAPPSTSMKRVISSNGQNALKMDLMQWAQDRLLGIRPQSPALYHIAYKMFRNLYRLRVKDIMLHCDSSHRIQRVIDLYSLSQESLLRSDYTGRGFGVKSLAMINRLLRDDGLPRIGEVIKDF